MAFNTTMPQDTNLQAIEFILVFLAYIISPQYDLFFLNTPYLMRLPAWCKISCFAGYHVFSPPYTHTLLALDAFKHD